MTAARQPWGTTIFCDDIRMESGNKVTLVGIYTDEMVVHLPFPFVLPKFGMWIKYFEVPDTETRDGKLTVWFPGDETPTLESDLPMTQLRTQMAANPRRDDPGLDRWVHMQMPILLAPLILKEPGMIKVRMLFGDSEVRLGTLPIRSASPI